MAHQKLDNLCSALLNISWSTSLQNDSEQEVSLQLLFRVVKLMFVINFIDQLILENIMGSGIDVIISCCSTLSTVMCDNSALLVGFLHRGLSVHGGSLTRRGAIPASVGWWPASVVALVTGNHAGWSQGTQQTAAKSLCSAVPADSGRRKRGQWHRHQEQVCTNTCWSTTKELAGSFLQQKWNKYFIFSYGKMSCF